jgi:hypothetical protein
VSNVPNIVVPNTDGLSVESIAQIVRGQREVLSGEITVTGKAIVLHLQRNEQDLQEVRVDDLEHPDNLFMPSAE